MYTIQDDRRGILTFPLVGVESKCCAESLSAGPFGTDKAPLRPLETNL